LNLLNFLDLSPPLKSLKYAEKMKKVKKFRKFRQTPQRGRGERCALSPLNYLNNLIYLYLYRYIRELGVINRSRKVKIVQICGVVG